MAARLPLDLLPQQLLQLLCNIIVSVVCARLAQDSQDCSFRPHPDQLKKLYLVPASIIFNRYTFGIINCWELCCIQLFFSRDWQDLAKLGFKTPQDDGRTRRTLAGPWQDLGKTLVFGTSRSGVPIGLVESGIQVKSFNL